MRAIAKISTIIITLLFVLLRMCDIAGNFINHSLVYESGRPGGSNDYNKGSYTTDLVLWLPHRYNQSIPVLWFGYDTSTVWPLHMYSDSRLEEEEVRDKFCVGFTIYEFTASYG